MSAHPASAKASSGDTTATITTHRSGYDSATNIRRPMWQHAVEMHWWRATAALVAARAFIVTADSNATAAARPSCRATIDNPHWSKHRHRIDATARWRCSGHASDLIYELWIFHCPHKPHGQEPAWRGQGCKPAAFATGDIRRPKPDVRYTRYVPRKGKHGPKHTGWYIASNITDVWFHGHADEHEVISQPAYVVHP